MWLSQCKAGPCTTAIFFLALLFGEAAADLTKVTPTQGRSKSVACEQAKWQAYGIEQGGSSSPRVIVVEHLPEMRYCNDAKDKQIVVLNNALSKRAPIMSSNALGWIILGSTVLASTAAIRHWTHMHILPPSIRKTFGIEDAPVKPGVYKITQEELKALEALEEKALEEGNKVSKRNLPKDEDSIEERREDQMEKRAMFSEQGLSGASVAKYAALAGLGGYLLRAWQHPPAPPQYYRKREVEEENAEVQLIKRSPTTYSYGKAAGLIGLAGFAGWLSQVYGHEAKDQYPNGRRDMSPTDIQGDGILVRRDSDSFQSAKKQSGTVSSDLLQRRDDSSDATATDEIKVIDGDYKIDDQANASSSRLKVPKALSWQMLLISLATILFLTISSTQAAVTENEQSLSADKASNQTSPDFDSVPVKRSNRLLPSSWWSSAPSPYVPSAGTPFHASHNDIATFSPPQSEISQEVLEHAAAWDGHITNKEHQEAHQRWESSDFHDKLNRLEGEMKQAKLSESDSHHSSSSHRSAKKSARKLQPGRHHNRYLYEQSSASAPSPQLHDDGNGYDFTKYPDQFNRPHTLQTPPVKAAPSPSTTRSITESEHHKFKLDMGSVGIGIASTIAAEAALLGAIGVGRAARKARIKGLVPIEKSQSPVESVHHRQKAVVEDEIPLSEGMPSSSSQNSPLSQRMPGPSFKETRRRLSLNKRDLGEANDTLIDREFEKADIEKLHKRSWEGSNAPAHWSGYGAGSSSSGNTPYHPITQQYAEAPSWTSRPRNMQHLSEEDYQWIINRQDQGYESDEKEEYEVAPEYQQGDDDDRTWYQQSSYSGRHGGRRMLDQSAQGPSASTSQGADVTYPSFQQDCVQGAKITAGVFGGAAAAYGGTVGAIKYVKKVKKNRKEITEAMRVHPIESELQQNDFEDQVIYYPPQQEHDEYHPVKRSVYVNDSNDVPLEKRSPEPSNTWNTANQLTQPTSQWPTLSSLADSLPYDLPNGQHEAPSWTSRPLNLQDMPSDQYEQLMRDVERYHDPDGHQDEQASHTEAKGTLSHNDSQRKSRGSRRRLQDKGAMGPSTSTSASADSPSQSQGSTSASDETFSKADLASVALQAGITFGLTTGATAACVQKGVEKCRKSMRQRRTDNARRIRVVPTAEVLQEEEGGAVQQQQQPEGNHLVRRDERKEAPRLYKRSLTPSTPSYNLQSSVTMPLYDPSFDGAPRYIKQEGSLNNYGHHHQYLQDVGPSILASPLKQFEKFNVDRDDSIPSQRGRNGKPRSSRKLMQTEIVQGPDGGLGGAVGTGGISDDIDADVDRGVSTDFPLLTPTERKLAIGVTSVGFTAGIGGTAYLCHKTNKQRKERRRQRLQVQPEPAQVIEGVQMAPVVRLAAEVQPVEEHLVKRDLPLNTSDQPGNLSKRSSPLSPFGRPDQVYQSSSHVPSFDPSGAGDWRHSSYSGHPDDAPEWMSRPSNFQDLPAEEYYRMVDEMQATHLDEGASVTSEEESRSKGKSREKKKKKSHRSLRQEEKVNDELASEEYDAYNPSYAPSYAPAPEHSTSSQQSEKRRNLKLLGIGAGVAAGMISTGYGCSRLLSGDCCCCESCQPSDPTLRKRALVESEEEITTPVKIDDDEATLQIQKRSMTPSSSAYNSPSQLSQSGAYIPAFDLAGTGDWRHHSYTGHPDDAPEWSGRPFNFQGLSAEQYYKMVEEMQAADLDEEQSQALDDGTRRKSKSKEFKLKSKKKVSRREMLAEVSKKGGGGGGGGGHGGGGGGGHAGGAAAAGHGEGEGGHGAAFIPHGSGVGAGSSSSTPATGKSQEHWSKKDIGFGAGVAAGVCAGAMAIGCCVNGDPCCLCGGCDECVARPQKRSIEQDKIASQLRKRSLTPSSSPCGSPSQLGEGGGHVPHFDLTGTSDWRHSSYTGHPDEAPEWMSRPSNLQDLDADFYHKMMLSSEEEVAQQFQGEKYSTYSGHDGHYAEQAEAPTSSKSKRKKSKSEKKERSLRAGTAGGAAVYGGASFNPYGSTSGQAPQEGTFGDAGSNPHTGRTVGIAVAGVTTLLGTVLGCKYACGKCMDCQEARRNAREEADRQDRDAYLAERHHRKRSLSEGNSEEGVTITSPLQKRSTPLSPFGSPDQVSQVGGHVPHFDLSGAGDWRYNSYSGHPDDIPEYLTRPINLQDLSRQEYEELLRNSQHEYEADAPSNLDEVDPESSVRQSKKKSSSRRTLRGSKDELRSVMKAGGGGGGGGRAGGGGGGGSGASAAGEEEAGGFNPYIYGGGYHGGAAEGPSNVVVDHKNDRETAIIAGASVGATLAIGGGCMIGERIRDKRRKKKQQLQEEQERQMALEQEMQSLELQPPPSGSSSHTLQKRSYSPDGQWQPEKQRQLEKMGVTMPKVYGQSYHPPIPLSDMKNVPNEALAGKGRSSKEASSTSSAAELKARLEGDKNIDIKSAPSLNENPVPYWNSSGPDGYNPNIADVGPPQDKLTAIVAAGSAAVLIGGLAICNQVKKCKIRRKQARMAEEANRSASNSGAEMMTRQDSNYHHVKRQIDCSSIHEGEKEMMEGKQRGAQRSSLFDDDDSSLIKRAAFSRGTRKMMEDGIVLTTSLAAAAGGYAAVNAVLNSPDAVAEVIQ